MGTPTAPKRLERGLFITFEGPEGGGKSTQVAWLSQRLQEEGYAVVATREPGGTPLGEGIRNLLIDPQYEKMEPLTELLLFEAARVQHIQELIEPSLRAGKIVLCDRFYDSTLAYQGARSLSWPEIVHLNQICVGSCQPQLTFLLDLDYEAGRQRLAQRCQDDPSQLDRIEREQRSFFEQLRHNYLALARGERGPTESRWRLLDASQPRQEVARAIWREVLPFLESRS